MLQPLNLYSSFQASAKTLLAKKQEKKRQKPLLGIWQVWLSRLHRIEACAPATRNWLEGLVPCPNRLERLLSQLVYWLKRRKIPVMPHLIALGWWFLTNREIYPERLINRKINRTVTLPTSNIIIVPITIASLSTRQQICKRLQELAIPCWHTADGRVWVEVNNVVVAMLVRSTVKQFVSPRNELVLWLERCWHSEVL